MKKKVLTFIGKLIIILILFLSFTYIIKDYGDERSIRWWERIDRVFYINNVNSKNKLILEDCYFDSNISLFSIVFFYFFNPF